MRRMLMLSAVLLAITSIGFIGGCHHDHDDNDHGNDHWEHRDDHDHMDHDHDYDRDHADHDHDRGDYDHHD